MTRQSITDRLEQYFRAREGVWLDGLELALVGGQYGWRTRCSDLRKRGMVIENRVRRVKTPQGQTFQVSEYRYLASKPAQLPLEMQA